MVPDRVGRQRKLEKAAASQTSSGTTPKMPEDTHQNCLRTSACAKDSDTPKYRDTLRGNILFCDPPQRLTAIIRDTSIRQPETGDVTRKPKVDDKRVSTERLDSPITLSSEARQRPFEYPAKGAIAFMNASRPAKNHPILQQDLLPQPRLTLHTSRTMPSAVAKPMVSPRPRRSNSDSPIRSMTRHGGCTSSPRLNAIASTRLG